MTNNTTSSLLAPLNNTNSTNSTNSNLNGTINNTNQTLAMNNSNRILFCKSRATFFKKVYDAISKQEKATSLRNTQVNKLQTSGKVLTEFMDKDCFTDAQLDENQLYSI